MEATDASRLVCVVVVSYQEYSLTQTKSLAPGRKNLNLPRTTLRAGLARTGTNTGVRYGSRRLDGEDGEALIAP